jgi:hypothetical protein
MRTISILIGGLALAACTGTDGDDQPPGDDVPDGVVDVRVPIPEPDPAYLDIVTPEATIEPGAEKMWCYYVDNDDPELAVSTMQALQGQYGHHVVLVTTTEPKASGTWEDCSAREDMGNFRSFVLPVSLPDGYAIRVPDGMQYVVQVHYVNAGDAPILIRDVARLSRVPIAEVTTWVATLTTNVLDITIPPGPKQTTFDCTIQEDLDLLILGGHMHELGARFTIDVGPSADALDSLYLVDPWEPSYRNTPPVSLFLNTPHHLPAGTVVRTTCEWMNPGNTNVEFPSEMCTAFGYLAGTDRPFHCEPGGS